MRFLLGCSLFLVACAPDPGTLSREIAGSDAGGFDASSMPDAPSMDAPSMDAPSMDAPSMDAPSMDAGGADAGCTRAPEPDCPATLDGYEPMDPQIASGSQCRGACGPNCPATCQQTSTSTCMEWQDECGWHAKVCTYDVRVCGSHEGCRVHDSCYDDCVTAIWPAGCRRQCDIACVNTYSVAECNAWRTGQGPFDSQISYLGAASSYTYDSTCY